MHVEGVEQGMSTVEPVFGNIKKNKGFKEFTYKNQILEQPVLCFRDPMPDANHTRKKNKWKHISVSPKQLFNTVHW